MNNLLSMLNIKDERINYEIDLMFQDNDFENLLIIETEKDKIQRLITTTFNVVRKDPKQLDLFQNINISTNKDFIEFLRHEYPELKFTPYYCDSFGL